MAISNIKLYPDNPHLMSGLDGINEISLSDMGNSKLIERTQSVIIYSGRYK